VEEAFAPQSITLQLEDDIDISRGDMIVKSDNLPAIANELSILLCWMDNKPLITGNKYLLQLNSRLVKTIIKEIEYKLDVNSLQKEFNPASVGLNDIVKVKIKTASPVAFDSYDKLSVNGGGILIDETSNVTVGACMIQAAEN
jgi:sulfate adenylyltransferase subunit 1